MKQMDRIRAPRHLTVPPGLATALAKGQIGPLAFTAWAVAGAHDGDELAAEELAKRCGTSPRTLKRALAELKEAGWYAAIPQGRGRGFMRVFAEPREVRAVIKNYRKKERKKATKSPLPPEAAAWAGYVADLRADRNHGGYARTLRRALARGEPEAVASYEGFCARLAMGWTPADGECWRPPAAGGG
jgi:hypothetical protein